MVKLKALPDIQTPFNRLGKLIPSCQPKEQLKRGLQVLKVHRWVQDAVNKLFSTKGLPEDPDRRHNAIVNRMELFRIRLECLVEQLEDNPLLPRMNTGNNNSSGARIPTKTMMEIVTPGPLRIQTLRHDEHEAMMPHVPIDPIWVNKILLDNLGLSDWKATAGDSKADQLSTHKEAIPEVRRILTSAKPVLENWMHQPLRMFRLTEGSQEGMILLANASNPHHKAPSVLELFAAIRRIKHIDLTHEEEEAILLEMQSSLQWIVENLPKWKTWSERAKERRKKKLLAMASQLTKVTAKHKTELRKRINSALDFRDSRGRTNPSASTRKLMIAIEAIEERLKDTRGISAHLKHDASTLRQTALKEGKPMQKFFLAVEALGNDPAELDAALEDLDETKSKMEKVKFEPYLSYAKAFISWTDKVLAEIDSGENYESSYLALYLITKLKKIHGVIMHAYEDISLNGGRIDKNTLSQKLEAFADDVKDHKFRDDLEVPDEHKAAFYKVFFAHHTLVEDLIDAIQDDEKFKELVKNFDFRENVKGLAV